MENMVVSEVIKKCAELGTALDAAIKREDARAEKNAEIEKFNEETAQKNIDRSKELDAREAKIKPIEDIVKLKEDAEALMKEANKKLEDAENMKADTKSWREAEKLAMNEVKIANRNDALKLVEERKMIAQEWAILKEKQKTYKTEILESLAKRTA